MKKRLFIFVTIAILSLILSGCANNEQPKSDNISNSSEAINARDLERRQNISDITFALNQYYQTYQKYPEASDDFCARDLIRTLQKEEFLSKPIADPNLQEPEGVNACEPYGVYYFFRMNNPDFYTFAVKMEGTRAGNSDLNPVELSTQNLEDLKAIRQNIGVSGHYFYIIGNYPTELLNN